VLLSGCDVLSLGADAPKESCKGACVLSRLASEMDVGNWTNMELLKRETGQKAQQKMAADAQVARAKKSKRWARKGSGAESK